MESIEVREAREDGHSLLSVFVLRGGKRVLFIQGRYDPWDLRSGMNIEHIHFNGDPPLTAKVKMLKEAFPVLEKEAMKRGVGLLHGKTVARMANYLEKGHGYSVHPAIPKEMMSEEGFKFSVRKRVR